MIRTITIKNFLGITAQELTVDAAGLLIEGGNGRGKSTILKAIKATLDGAGISPEAVRKGESAAEILIDLDDDTVRRRITAAGATTLTIEDAQGSTRKKPAAYLSSLLGLAMLDPLDLVLAEPKERRALVLRAVPCRATPELLAPWLPPGTAIADVLAVLAPDAWELHGLEVVDQVRAWATSRRTAAGALVKEREKAITAANAKLRELQVAADLLAGAMSKEAATTAAVSTLHEKVEVDGRAAAAGRAAAFVAGRRAEATRLQEEAYRVRAAAPLAPTAEEQEAALSAISAARELETEALSALEEQAKTIADIEEQLRQAKAKRDELASALRDRASAAKDVEAAYLRLDERERAAHDAFEKAAELDERATRELAAIAEVGGEAPTPEEVAAAHAAYAAAMAEVERSAAAEQARAARDRARADLDAATAAHAVVERTYKDLDKSSKALATEVPRQLLADAAAGLSGLVIEGDTILADDGQGQLVDVEQLSTAAQMKFALGIAKRLNEKSKILLVDGLERVEAGQRATFVSLAIEGGYQLFATRVTEGPLAIWPIGGAS